MSIQSNTVDAPLVIKNLPDLACFTSVQELLQSLPQYLFAQIPLTITNVIVSNVQPLDSQRTSIWFRTNNSGLFIGIYVYSNGTWNQFFPAPNQLTRIYRTSNTALPEGYEEASVANTSLPLATINTLKTQWIMDPTNTYFQVLDVVFTGL